MTKATGISFDDAIFGLDIDSQHIGWAVVRGSHHQTGHGRFRQEPFGKFLLTYSHWLRDLVQEHQPAVICIEQPFVSAGKIPAVDKLYRMHGVTDMALAGYIGAIDTVYPGTWKKHVIGSGAITTKAKKGGVIVNHLVGMGFKVDQIDEADALAIALYERKKLTGRLV